MRLSHFRAAMALALACALALTACRDAAPPAVVTPEIEHIVSSLAAGATTDEVRRFYQGREFAPVWVAGDGLSARGRTAFDAIDRAAQQHGLDPARYRTASLTSAHDALATMTDTNRGEALARIDVEITRALLALGRDAAVGVVDPRRVDARWRHRRALPDLVAVLNAAIDKPETWPAAVAPQHAGYADLVDALAQLREQHARGEWPVVPMTKFEPGKSDPAVVTLRQRLLASGDLSTGANASSLEYDEELASAVRRFQQRHGLDDDGIAGKGTIAAMNVPMADRIRQIEINLERWRWMPDDLGDEHLFVNIPAFELTIRAGAEVLQAMPVVVGKRGNETPIFSGRIETIVFSPYWNIPETIANAETAPAIAQDIDYMRRQGIEVRRSGRPIDPDDIDWSDPDELERLSFRQRPGPKNALGGVKFLFPNPYHVYLHDTPADGLFGRASRAFSHGCVRVANPQALAEYLLHGDATWTPERIATAMRSGVERHVRVTPRPVHIAYFTASASGGVLRLLPDIYRLDARQLKLEK